LFFVFLCVFVLFVVGWGGGGWGGLGGGCAPGTVDLSLSAWIVNKTMYV